jgi:hypothetical protein
MDMKLTLLVIITALGVMIPLLWITGTLTSIVYFIRHRENLIRKEGAFALNPQLGFTMADGGDPMAEAKKESAAVTQGSMTETSQSSTDQITRRPVSKKMFWWGGYY